MTIMQNIATEQQRTSPLNQTQGLRHKELPRLNRKSQLSKIIKNSNGVTDTTAIALYWDTLRSWHTPMKQYQANGDVVHIKKLKSKGIYINYKQLAEDNDCSVETMRRKIVKLEKLGLVTRDYQHSTTATTKSYNQLIIYVWKDTPHFFNEYGLDKDEIKDIKPYTSHKHIANKHGIEFCTHNPTNITAVEDYPVRTLADTKELREPFLYKKDRSTKSNFFENNFVEEKEQVVTPIAKTKQPISKPTKKSSFNKPKHLADFYPISEKDCRILQEKSGREFNLNAMNEILKNIAKKLPDREFFSKKGFMKYMTLSFSSEMRDAVKINNETFRIRSNQSAEDQQEQREEQYLTELENSLQASPEWNLKKKLAAVLDRSRAYKLLTAYKSIELRDGVARINLLKHVELTEIEQELVLSQIKASHCGIERGGYQQIERLELNMPEKQHKDARLGKQEANLAIFPNTIWGKMRACIAKSLGDTGIALDKSWFSRLDAEINEESRAITLKAPSDFVKDWVEREYQQTIEFAVKSFGFSLQGIS